MADTLITKHVIIGVDEAGRGCAWGSVFAGAVILPEELTTEELMTDTEKFLLRDSKKLSEKRRTESADMIYKKALGWAVGECTSAEIDRMNILNATFTAMHRAITSCIRNLKEREDYDKIRYIIDEIRIDGNRFREYIDEEGIPMNHVCIIGGDATDRSIAAASILAKTSRDNHVKAEVCKEPDLDKKWGMSKHKGYCTRQHTDALREHGIHRLHRVSYAPVKNVIANMRY